MTDEQWRCISAPLQPMVIVAGAGTGKTTVMSARVCYLVASGLVQPDRVLGLTFTNKAAAELGARTSRLLRAWRSALPAGHPGPEGEPSVSTYHAFATRFIGEQGLRVGVEPGARLLGDPVVAQLAVAVVRDAAGLGAEHPSPIKFARQLVQLDSELAEQTVTTDDLRDFDRRVLEDLRALPKVTAQTRAVAATSRRRLDLADLVDELRRRKAEVGLDFSDQMRLGVQLVRAGPQLAGQMRHSWGVVLLDEYQDTSIAQRVMLSTLFGGHPVTAVGDPLQAIYGWRSASVANIDAFAEHFDAAGDPLVLSVNRRSGESVLAAANQVSADLRARHPQVASLRAPGPRAAEVRAALLPTAAEEIAWIADQVACLVAAGRDPADIAVLARVGRDLAPLRAAIEGAGVPTAVLGREGMADLPEVGQVVAVMRMIADPLANSATTDVLAGPRWRIGVADLALLAQRAAALARLGIGSAQLAPRPTPWPSGPPRGSSPGAGQSAVTSTETGSAAGNRGSQPPGPAVASGGPVRQDLPASLLEAALDPGPALGLSRNARERLAAFATEFGQLQGAASAGLVELTHAVIEATGAAEQFASTSAPGDVPGLSALRELVGEFADARGDGGLVAFLACLDLAAQFGRPEAVERPGRPYAVQLMTVHKAKGLEWPVVVLPHLSQGVFPSRRASPRWPDRPDVVPVDLRDDRHVLPALRAYRNCDIDDYRAACRDHDRSGEDRLAYVAITRARDVLVASGHWWGPTQRTRRGPSPYLLAIREHDAQPDDRPWTPPPEPGPDGQAATNPALASRPQYPWPASLVGNNMTAAADLVLAAHDGALAERRQLAALAELDNDLGEHAQRLRAIDDDLALLVANLREQRDGERVVRLPDVLTASQLVELGNDPQAFARRLARPMPSPPSPRADLGSRFHEWVEARLGVRPLITDDDLLGAADADQEDNQLVQLRELQEHFERLEYARMVPFALEEPFALVLGDRVIRGRIDAVFRHPGPVGQRWEVVDWKTSSRESADPVQLAVYRFAWARRMGIDVAQVDAAFVYVATGRVHRPTDLMGFAELAELLAGDTTRRNSRVGGLRPLGAGWTRRHRPDAPAPTSRGPGSRR